MRDLQHADDIAVPKRGRLRLPVSTATGGLALGFSSLNKAVDAADLAADRRITS